MPLELVQEPLALIPNRGDPNRHRIEEVLYRTRFEYYLDEGLIDIPYYGRTLGEADRVLSLEIIQYLGTKGGVLLLTRVWKKIESGDSPLTAWTSEWRDFYVTSHRGVNHGLTKLEILISVVDFNGHGTFWIPSRHPSIVREATAAEIRLGKSLFAWLATLPGQMFVEELEKRIEAEHQAQQFEFHTRNLLSLSRVG